MQKNLDKGQSFQIPINSSKRGISISFRKPNIQFIKQAKLLSPRANELVLISEELRDRLHIKGLISLSTRTGSGFFINTANFEPKNFNRDNIVEVIDFDPVRNNMMVIGNEPPANDAAFHWFIYRGFPNVFGILCINESELFDHFQTDQKPVLNVDDEIMDTNFALKILRSVKDSKIILLNDQTIIIVDETLSEAYKSLKSNVDKFSSVKVQKKTKKGKKSKI